MTFSRTNLSCAILAIVNMSVYANSEIDNAQDSNNNKVHVALNTIHLTAENDNEIGKTVYTKEDLERTPNSSKNLTDFFKVNPNVQFGNNARSSLNQGELSPSEISINGALPYENKYIVNGMSLNNNINPIGSTSNSNADLMGSSQAVAINTDLLCEVTLLDSNVSAEYGEFTGGVVKAETCAPQTPAKELHGSISYDYTSSDWSKINYANEDEKIEFEESVSEKYQPEFTKQGISTTLYGNFNEYFGFSLAGSHRWSEIPLKTNIIGLDKVEQKRQSDNLLLETFIRPSDQTQIKIGAQFLDLSGDYFQNNAKNSDVQHQSDSQAFFIQMKNQFDTFKLEQQLNHQSLKNSRNGADDMYSWLKSETKNWNATGTLAQEGSFGQFEQKEKRLEYAIKAIFDPITIGKFNSTVKMGAGYGHYEAYWKRENPSYWYVSSANLSGESCYSIEGFYYDACDEGMTINNKYQGQYAKTRTKYGAGTIDIQQDRWHAFVENAMNYDDYILSTIGFRTDYDTLTQNNHLAPRTSLIYQPFQNATLRFTGGWNRYYGLNSFANELQDQKRLLQTTETRKTVQGEWQETAGSQYSRMQTRNQLNTPYSDETVFAITGQHLNLNWGLKWVHRDNKDQIVKSADITIAKPEGSGTYNLYGYNNSGYSKTDIYTFSINNITPFTLKNSKHYLSLAADYTDTKRNFSSYDSTYADPNELIYYNGQLIEAGSRPADNFNTPWTIRTSWNISFDNIPLQINNFFIYKRYYDAMKRQTNGYSDLDGNKYDQYSPSKSPSKFQWDMRATYTLPFKNYNTILGLTINNVTNKNNTVVNTDGTTDSEIGRQFIADITFKF